MVVGVASYVYVGGWVEGVTVNIDDGVLGVSAVPGGRWTRLARHGMRRGMTIPFTPRALTDPAATTSGDPR